MTLMDEQPDDFSTWATVNGFQPEDMADHFSDWVAESTGWDGKSFSLTDDERRWIQRASEIVELLSLYAVSEQPQPLQAALRCLNNMRPLPGSLRLE